MKCSEGTARVIEGDKKDEQEMRKENCNISSHSGDHGQVLVADIVQDETQRKMQTGRL